MGTPVHKGHDKNDRQGLSFHLYLTEQTQMGLTGVRLSHKKSNIQINHMEIGIMGSFQNSLYTNSR